MGAAGPGAVGIFLKVLAVDLSGESIFGCSWLLCLCACKVGRRDDGKTSDDDVGLE